MNYPRPLNADERRRKRLREKEEKQEKIEIARQRQREKWCRDWSEFDPTRVFPKDSISEWFQMAEAKKRGINLTEARIEAKMAQLQAMKALINDLPKFKTGGVGINNVVTIVDEATKAQWEGIKSLAKTKAQEWDPKGKAKAVEVEAIDKDKGHVVDDKGKGKGIEVEAKDNDEWGDDELLFDFDSE